MRRPLRALTIVIVMALAVSFDARQHTDDVSYDGRFTFVRLRWSDGYGRRGWGAAWNHDYPRADRHVSLILSELTLIDTAADKSLILSLDDPRLFTYPIVYMWEPGFWVLTDVEAEAFRAYLLKGGFAVFEDFDGAAQWSHFAAQIQRVLPGARFEKLDATDRVFDTFFRIANLDSIVHPMTGQRPSYYGVFEDNDRTKRLLLVANFDNDIPEYWEWSGEGFFPFDTSTDAYKVGVNYIVYGLTH